MSYQHKDLAAGRWNEMPFMERMANVGSEVERALGWRRKNNLEYSARAFERALELIDLTMAHPGHRSQLKEIARVREALVDYFCGANEYESTEISWRKYFSHFTYAVRRNS